MENGVEAGIHANIVPICVVEPIGWIPSLEMSPGLRSRSEVDWVQNNTSIDNPSFSCHLLTT